MKALSVGLFLMLASFAAEAQRQGQNQVGPMIGTQLRDSINATYQYRVQAAAQPWRVVRGVTNSIHERGWVLIDGEVYQNTEKGLNILLGNGEIVHVTNTPAIADGQRFFAYAQEVGVYKYANLRNTTRTIRSFDPGVPCAPPSYFSQPTRRVAVAPEQNEATVKRVVGYQLLQASNGYPSFQFEVGKRYLQGDGLEVNQILARHWLESACTNGYTQASNLLKQLPALQVGSK